MRSPRGTLLLIMLLLACLAYAYGRVSFLNREGPPAFFVEERPGIAVLLGDGFPGSGVHQISDGTPPLDVIKLAGFFVGLRLAENPLLVRPLLDGESLDILLDGTQVIEIKRSWMPAAQRIALGIPLDPERMSREDWEALPGIGPGLAQAIEEERQKNGDFHSLEGLKRVKGVGPKRLDRWRKFFKDSD